MSLSLVEGMKLRLAEMDNERDHLLALIVLYDPSFRAGEAPPATRDDAVPAAPTAHRAPVGELTPNGPTDRLLAVARASPGLTYAELVRRAAKGVVTKSPHPDRSVGSTLATLLKRGAIKRVDGKHYASP